MTASEITLSIVVVVYNMAREAPRTLHTLSREFQHGVDDLDYEVIVVDNGSSDALSADLVQGFGPEFKHLRVDGASQSPCAAINQAAELARGTHISVCIDGARMLSPGTLRTSVLASRLATKAVVTTLSYHLGPKLQNKSVLEGYDQRVEDQLLDTIDWGIDGYQLFTIACLAGSSQHGWARTLPESNFVTVSRETFDALGGFDERFEARGGGLANLDYLKRALELDDSLNVLLLGEGTFHQFHGGVATNAPLSAHPWNEFEAEYRQIRGVGFEAAFAPPLLVGSIPAPFVDSAADLLAIVRRNV